MTQPAPRLRALLRRARPRLPAVALCAGAAVVVAALGLSVHSGSTLVQADLAILRAVHAHSFAEATAAATAITDLAATGAIIATAAIVALVLGAARHWRGAVAVLLAVGATQLAVAVLKGLVGRHRPPEESAFANPAGFSFPSGHSASAMAVYGLIAFLLARASGSRLRTAACWSAVAMVVAVGATRVYLGAHYPSDVVAGWMVGALIAGGSLWLVGHSERALASAAARRRRARLRRRRVGTAPSALAPPG
jgi:membrane-associated phospholipid phosphatase